MVVILLQSMVMLNVCIVAHQLGGTIGISCQYAARGGHVECLRVAHELGGAIGISCVYAAMEGHVSVCV